MLIVPLQSLPQDAGERSKILGRYFQRQVASSRRVEQGWAIDLAVPASAGFYIDPDLEGGLRWWSDDMSVSAIPLAVRQEDGFQLSLNDNWTLLSWSCWLSGRVQPPAVLSILHLDSHGDLMSPRLSRRSGKWVDLISGKTFDLKQPGTVASAIGSGAVGIGSFICPLLHEVPSLNLFHLCHRHCLQRPPGRYAMKPVLGGDDPLFEHARRPQIELTPSSERSDPLMGTYLLGGDLDSLLDNIPAGPLLLHLDLDYFNNRYDGNPDWEAAGDRHDPGQDEIVEAIDTLFAALTSSHLVRRVEDISAALSPSFFPARFWPVAVDRLRSGVRLLASAPALQGGR
ncbi:MAG TPA: hypothetical protein VLU25_11975 [Acidobacteriota bacterium]|nr:hypothetical protein [Acidobacteriota bacterium]